MSFKGGAILKNLLPVMLVCREERETPIPETNSPENVFFFSVPF